jgi:hypothetical protein
MAKVGIDDELELARAQVDVARKRVQLLEDEQFRAKVPSFRKLVGTCWRYRNSYSCPQEPSDYWFAYRKLVGLKDKEQAFIAQEFQIDKHGELRASGEASVPIYRADHEMTGWKQISAKEYRAALRRARALIDKLAK